MMTGDVSSRSVGSDAKVVAASRQIWATPSGENRGRENAAPFFVALDTFADRVDSKERRKAWWIFGLGFMNSNGTAQLNGDFRKQIATSRCYN